jgi:hypothetical protein
MCNRRGSSSRAPCHTPFGDGDRRSSRQGGSVHAHGAVDGIDAIIWRRGRLRLSAPVLAHGDLRRYPTE